MSPRYTPHSNSTKGRPARLSLDPTLPRPTTDPVEQLPIQPIQPVEPRQPYPTCSPATPSSTPTTLIEYNHIIFSRYTKDRTVPMIALAILTLGGSRPTLPGHR
jgi:hypothetical protein